VIVLAGAIVALCSEALIGKVSGHSPQDSDQSNNDFRDGAQLHREGRYHAHCGLAATKCKCPLMAHSGPWADQR